MPRVNGNTNTKRPRHDKPDACVQERSTTLESDEDDGERDGGNEDADRGGNDDDTNGNDGMWIPLDNQTSWTHKPSRQSLKPQTALAHVHALARRPRHMVRMLMECSTRVA